MAVGEPAVIDYELPDVYHAFRKGHRVMVQVQSSWFPLVDRNPQTFIEIPRAKPEDFIADVQRLKASFERISARSLDGLPEFFWRILEFLEDDVLQSGA